MFIVTELYDSVSMNIDILLEFERALASGGFQASVINEPTLEATPVAPRLSQSLMLGIAAGLLFGLLLAVFSELSDQSFRSPADIRKRLGMPLIGHIPPIRANVPAEVELALEPTLVSALRAATGNASQCRLARMRTIWGDRPSFSMC